MNMPFLKNLKTAFHIPHSTFHFPHSTFYFLLSIFFRRLRPRRGQLMLMTVLILGGTMLGATAIAGLITTYRLQQASRARDSAMAIMAADAGLEAGLYQCFKLNDCTTAIPQTSLPNGATYAVTFNTGNPSSGEIRSLGKSATAARALSFTY